MAYTKTTWNNLSNPPINADNLNKIEQGIYDNSLGIDKINPSGTATTTAEIEEGQISDVIGFKSLKLKGQTSQGENPSPDSPQEVKNVSGYNVVAINGSKNLFDKDINIVTPGYLNASGAVVTSDATLSYQDRFIKVQPSTAYTISSGTNTIYRIAEYTSDKTFIARTLNANASRSYTFATSSQTHYIKMAGTLITVLNTLQIEKGNAATSYVAHQGNNFEINLGKNLFNEKFRQGNASELTDTKNIFNETNKLLTAGTYTFSTNIPSTMKFAIFGNTQKFPTSNTVTYNSTFKTGINTFTFTLSQDLYFGLMIANNDSSQITPSDVSEYYFQLEKGAIATSYAPYYNIEICKIGTYQDYIFKKDGKWYKHKEVEKITLNGSETPTINTALTNTTRALYSNILPYNAKAGAGSSICNLLPYYENWVTDVEGFYLDNNTTNLVFRINKSTVGTTITSVNNFLSENNMTVYYIVETAIEEEITYTPLIRQLDEVYNSGLYDVTNISQDNSSEAFILDIEACKNNINGIVEYIRR